MKILTTCMLVAGFSAFSTFAYGLHETNCSNGDGSVQRIEEEIWGANIVEWNLNGNKLTANEVKFVEESEVLLDQNITVSDNGLETRVKEYAIKVVLPDGKEEFVICTRWENDAID